MLIYDGDCGFCTRVAAWAVTGTRVPVTPVPWQELGDDALGVLGLDSEMTSHAAWWVESDGSLLRGHRAVARALGAGPGWRSVAGRALGLPGVRSVASVVYDVVARNRHLLPGATPACRAGPVR